MEPFFQSQPLRSSLNGTQRPRSIEAAACQRPVRSRRRDLYIALSVEILGALFALLRLYSRWWTMSRYEADDYIMIAATVCYVVFLVVGHLG